MEAQRLILRFNTQKSVAEGIKSFTELKQEILEFTEEDLASKILIYIDEVGDEVEIYNERTFKTAIRSTTRDLTITIRSQNDAAALPVVPSAPSQPVEHPLLPITPVQHPEKPLEYIRQYSLTHKQAQAIIDDFLLKLANPGLDQADQAIVLGTLGEAYLFQDNFTKAEYLLEQAWMISAEAPGMLAEWFTTIGVLKINFQQGNIAAEQFERALKLLELEPNDALKAYIWAKMSGIAQDDQECHDYAKNSLEIAQKLKIKRLIVISQLAVASEKARSRNYSQCFSELAECTQMASQNDMESVVLQIEIFQGFTYGLTGKMEKAVYHYSMCLLKAKQLNSTLYQALASASLSELYAKQQDLKSAKSVMTAACNAYKKIYPPSHDCIVELESFLELMKFN